LLVQELRKAMRLTQAELAWRAPGYDLARRAARRHAAVDFAEAMGGRLAIVAELPNRPPVRIKRFSVLTDEAEEFDEIDRFSSSQENAA
jgi:hypothetical protein